ncbi:hypothetical protein PO909_029795 [Leuciscus waleckii]
MFHMVRLCLCLWSLVGVFGVTDEMNSVSVMQGEFVTLHTDREMRSNDLIHWRFGPENTLIAEINKSGDRISVYDDVLDGRFRDRLKVDRETGSLTITNTRTEHAGFYQLQNNHTMEFFMLSVYAPLPVPVIFSYCPQTSSSSSSSSSSSVSHVTLSWYKGNGLLSSIGVSDLSISLSLPLEVDYQDKNPYRCVLNGSFTEQTQHLDITQLCHTCSGTAALILLILAFVHWADLSFMLLLLRLCPRL